MVLVLKISSLEMAQTSDTWNATAAKNAGGKLAW